MVSGRQSARHLPYALLTNCVERLLVVLGLLDSGDDLVAFGEGVEDCRAAYALKPCQIDYLLAVWFDRYGYRLCHFVILAYCRLDVKRKLYAFKNTISISPLGSLRFVSCRTPIFFAVRSTDRS